MVLLMMAIACTGDDPVLNKLEPELLLTSEVLDFAEVVIGESLPLDLLLTNVGLAPLALTSASFSGDGAAAFSVGALPAEIAEDETFILPVTFSPTDVASYAATLALDWEEADAPAEVAVSGAGVPVPTPDIEVAPGEVDCGYVEPPNGTYCTLYVSNVGNADLIIDQAYTTGSGAILLTGEVTRQLAPGDGATLIFEYTPTSTLGDTTVLTLVSNDPDEPSLEVTVIGNGGGNGDYPVALIEGATSAEPLDTLLLDGSGSYDSDGDPLVAYEWTVTDGESTAILTPSADGLSAEVSFQTAGSYIIELRVQDNEGVWSSPYPHAVNVAPSYDLYIDLVWDTELADLDLHLAMGGGAIFLEPGDANYCNDDVDWAAAGTSDDPLLLKQDDDGFGPEAMAVDLPAEDAYAVRVHYYDDHGDGDVVATVSIWVRGSVEASWSRVMSRNDVWDVATVQWSSNASTTYVIEETTDLYVQDHRECYE